MTQEHGRDPATDDVEADVAEVRDTTLDRLRSAAEVLRRCDDTPPTLLEVAELAGVPVAEAAAALGCCGDHPCCEPVQAA